MPLCCHLYQVPNQQRGRLELQELRGAQEAALQQGLGCRGAEAWGPSRRRRLRAWKPDQVVLGLLGMRCPRFDPGDGTQGTKLYVCLFLSVSLMVLGLRFLEARGQCALEQSQAPGMWGERSPTPHRGVRRRERTGLEAGGGQWRPNWYLSCLTAFLPGPQSPHLYTEQVELPPGFQMSGKKGSALVERMEGPGSPIPAPLPAGDAGFWVCHPWVGCPRASTSLDWRYFQLPGGMGMGQRQGLGETLAVFYPKFLPPSLSVALEENEGGEGFLRLC